MLSPIMLLLIDNDQRQALAPTTSARRSTLPPQEYVPLARLHACTPACCHAAMLPCFTNHNHNALLPLVNLSKQCSKLASQAALRPIDEKSSCENGLIDCMGSCSNLQKRLLVALNGILCSLLPLHTPTIHNFSLWVVLQENRSTATVE